MTEFGHGSNIMDSSTARLESAKHFQLRFLSLIVAAWVIPAVFGLSFLLFIELFTPEQMVGIMTTPLEPVFILVSLAFAFIYFRNFARPLLSYLNEPEKYSASFPNEHIKRFPLYFWTLFLGYLLLAPASVIVSAEIYTDFLATPVDWFRIHLVALIVSIIVGLPIFFTMFDLFGKTFGKATLQHPIVSLRTKVFLIGALVPLLIDTMLVQYFWTRTGYFTGETFFIWFLLELLAVAGALLFVRSISQSLKPLHNLIEAPHGSDSYFSIDLVSASTDELGKLTQDLRLLLEEQQVHRERLALNNKLLSISHRDPDLETLFTTIIKKSSARLDSDICFLALHDNKQNDLVFVAHTGAVYSSEGHFRLSLDEPSVFAEVYNENRIITIEDTLHDPRANAALINQFHFGAIAGAPLSLEGKPIGILACATRTGPYRFPLRKLAMLEAFAQEAALVQSFARDMNERKRVEHAITQIMEGVSTAIGEQFFGAIAKTMGDILNADSVAIGVVAEDEGDQIQTLAFYLDGSPLPEKRYDLKGTPCSMVIGQDARCYLSNIQKLFPDNEELARTGMEAYVGIPLSDSKDKPLGVLFAMFRRPLDNPEFSKSVMHIFAARTSAEIERLRNEGRIKHMAYYDSLTGLPNRELVIDRLNQALAHAIRSETCVAIMLLDLDQFKAINDSLGHPVGDKLLSEVAQRLQDSIRDEDTVARLGGDEFVILLTDIGNREDALTHSTRIADKIHNELSPSYFIEGHNLIVTPSIGIALYPDDGDTAEALIKHADTAMYQAKDHGRNNYKFFSPAMNVAAVTRLELESALRKALEEDQFKCVLQPKLSISDNTIIGAELLLRWNHPTMGIVSPNEFIPVAEESGLILPIGTWVMRQACCHAHEILSSQNYSTELNNFSFNVSPRQFSQPDFVKLLQEAIEMYGIRPDCLELEVTENILIHDIQEVDKKLKELKRLSVRISIDDFGTGYSSLRYLQQLPIDTIKIDRAFVSEISENHNNAVIVETILAMAGHLGLKTVAEGVETEEQLEILRNLGCQSYQGYWFSKPVSPETFKQLLKSQAPHSVAN
jgi:diguanylate cyclase (GGDEF)-like protein